MAATQVPLRQVLLERVRAALKRVRRVREQKMFGGTTFMVDGKMCISAGKDRLMFRVDPAQHDAVLGRNGSRTVRMKGRAYRGFLFVQAARLRDAKALKFWIGKALAYNKRAKRSK